MREGDQDDCPRDAQQQADPVRDRVGEFRRWQNWRGRKSGRLFLGIDLRLAFAVSSYAHTLSSTLRRSCPEQSGRAFPPGGRKSADDRLRFNCSIRFEAPP